MIKKYILGSFIFLFGFIGFSFSGYTRQVGFYGFNPYLQSYDVNLTSAGNPLTQNLGYTKQMFYLYDYLDDYINYKMFWFWNRGLPYIYLFSNYHRYGDNILFNQGNITNYLTCNEILTLSENMPSGCVNNLVGESTVNVFGNFLSSVDSEDYYFFEAVTNSSDNLGFNFCISSHSIGKSLCFSPTLSSSLTGSLYLDRNASFDNISSSLLENPPSFSSGSGDNSDEFNEIDKTDRTIEYFENQGFRREMCFVGTNDLTTLYGSGTESFQVGTGKTIFDLFVSEYVYIEDTDYGYQAVANWLNSRLTNYYQWFNFGELSSIKANYSSVDELISIYYYGQDERASFPFLNNPFAIYFMASNISDYVQMKSIADFEGEDVVDYCNLKVNGGTFDDLISPSTEKAVNRITSNTNNVGGFEDDDNNDGNIGSGSIGGTGENSYTGTWQSLQFTGKVTFRSFFDNAVESMREASSNMQNPFSGVLPNYIIFGFLLFALFKVLRH